MDDLIHKCDMFLKDTQLVPFVKKLLMVDKYGLPETKNACLNSKKLQDRSFIRDLKKKPGYKEISAELKNELLETAIDAFKAKTFCYKCDTFCPIRCCNCKEEVSAFI